jgi:hypothetical protein
MAATLVGRRANNAVSQGRCLVTIDLGRRVAGAISFTPPARQWRSLFTAGDFGFVPPPTTDIVSFCFSTASMISIGFSLLVPAFALPRNAGEHKVSG